MHSFHRSNELFHSAVYGIVRLDNVALGRGMSKITTGRYTMYGLRKLEKLHARKLHRHWHH